MTSYRNFVTADLRLTVLRLLAGAPGYELNGSILKIALDRYGHSIASDRLATELAWLQEQGLAELREFGGVNIAKLTARGLDVAEGRASVPGVARPSPGAGL